MNICNQLIIKNLPKKHFERVEAYLQSDQAKQFKPKTFAKVTAQFITSFANPDQDAASKKLEIDTIWVMS